MYAVIDLGSNSFHLLIARHTGNQFTVVEKRSKKIQLADGLNRGGRLSPAAINRGLDCLRLFKRILDGYSVRHLHVIATQALRQAKNARQFIEAAKTLGFDVEVISGIREAELIFRGICGPLPPCNGNRLVIDIGGASTEIALGNDEQILFAESIPMGCVSWRDRFFTGRIDYEQRGARAKDAARTLLQSSEETLSVLGWCETYASSGSAKMLSRIALANHWSHGEINRSGIQRIEDHISSIGHHSEINLKGLKPERQDLLAPGVSIMGTIMECLDIGTIVYSSTALREGVLGEVGNCGFDYQVTKGKAGTG